jgi:hypothetical protein
MICNLDRVANPSPCEVDRSLFLRGNPNSNHKLGYDTTRVLSEGKAKLKAHFNNAYSSVEFTPGMHPFLYLFIVDCILLHRLAFHFVSPPDSHLQAVAQSPTSAPSLAAFRSIRSASPRSCIATRL